jgi:DNA-binding MarR family transcriptional regulator
MQLLSDVSRNGATTVDDDVRAAAAELGKLQRRLFLDPHADHLGAIEERNLSLAHVRALYLLAGAPEPLSAGELATRLGLSPAAMSRALDTLVRRRLATRRESSADRRVRLVEIAERGRALVDELLVLRNARLEHFVTELDPEQRRRLADVLADVNAAAGEREESA